MKNIGSAFDGGWSLIAIENDSKDRTRQFLEEWREESEQYAISSALTSSHENDVVTGYKPRHIYLLDNVTDEQGSGGRQQHGIQFMAKLRNRYLNFHVYANGTAAKSTDSSSSNILTHYDYLIVFDADMKSYGALSVVKALQIGRRTSHPNNGILKSQPWAALSANGIHWQDRSYYDVFAFRSDVFPWPDARGSTGSRRDGDELLCAVQSKRIASDADPFEIHSGFGGLTIYNTNFILPTSPKETMCSYASINDNCEHILFNYCVRQRAMKACAPFLLVPSMVVENKNDASTCATTLERWGSQPWPAQCAASNCAEAFTGIQNSTTIGTIVPFAESLLKFDTEATSWCKWSADANAKPRPWLAAPT